MSLSRTPMGNENSSTYPRYTKLGGWGGHVPLPRGSCPFKFHSQIELTEHFTIVLSVRKKYN